MTNGQNPQEQNQGKQEKSPNAPNLPDKKEAKRRSFFKRNFSFKSPDIEGIPIKGDVNTENVKTYLKENGRELSKYCKNKEFPNQMLQDLINAEGQIAEARDEAEKNLHENRLKQYSYYVRDKIYYINDTHQITKALKNILLTGAGLTGLLVGSLLIYNGCKPEPKAKEEQISQEQKAQTSKLELLTSTSTLPSAIQSITETQALVVPSVSKTQITQAIPSITETQRVAQSAKQTQLPQYQTPWNITNLKTSSISNENAPFKVTQFIVDGQQLYSVKGRGHEKIHTNTLSDLIYVSSDSELVFNDDARKLDLDADRFYVSTLVTNSSGKALTKIKLKRKDTNAPTINRHAWSLGGAGKELETITYTENDIPFNMPFLVTANGEEYIVRKETSSYPESLNFYRFPKPGTKRRITPNGDIILESAQGIYNPTAVSKRDYEKMLTQVKTNSPSVQTNAPAPVGQILDN